MSSMYLRTGAGKPEPLPNGAGGQLARALVRLVSMPESSSARLGPRARVAGGWGIQAKPTGDARTYIWT